MALLAQAVIHQLRKRLGTPVADWDSQHLANGLFRGIAGDIRVSEDTTLVAYSNAPPVEHLRAHYEGLPRRLEADGINPRIPWLYDFKLDCRFR